eukprot:13938283-Heterocapsa_arctica.AAC.1
MDIRRFWDTDGVEWTIPTWASHLTHAICQLCYTRDYCSIWGVNRFCSHCSQLRQVFAYEGLELFNKEKDDLGRAL